MKASIVLLACLLGACAAAEPLQVSAGGAIVDTDRGDLTGRWKSADGRLVLSTMMADTKGGLTFAAAQGCSMAQGVLTPGPAGYRVRLYPNEGFVFGGCTRTGLGPAVAPFTGEIVQLQRQGATLLVSGSGVRRNLKRDKFIDYLVRADHLRGNWRLARGGRPLSAAEGATLQLSDSGFRLQSACGFVAGDGFATLPGLLVVLGGSMRTQSPPQCVVRTRGDELIGARQSVELRYRPESDRLESRIGSAGYEFVRG